MMKTLTLKSTFFLLILLAGVGAVNAQISFTNSNTVLHDSVGGAGSNHCSGCKQRWF
jgi:hypothetical protein